MSEQLNSEMGGRERTIGDRRLVLHIGAHKTGTTAIQNGLREHAGYLRQQGMAVFVQRFDQSFESAIRPGLYGLKFEDIDLDRVRRDFDQLTTATSAHTVVVSNEEMTKTWRSWRSVARVVASITRSYRDIAVILYVRRQDQVFESAYQQLVRNGRVKTRFDEFLADSADSLRWLEWDQQIEEYRKQFPEARFVVRCKEFVSAQGDILQDFLAQIGLKSIPENVRSKIHNERQTQMGTLIQRICAEFPTADRRMLYRLMSKRYPQSPSDPGASKVFFSPSARREFIRHFRGSNQKLFARYDLGSADVLSAWETVEDYPYPSTDEEALKGHAIRYLAQTLLDVERQRASEPRISHQLKGLLRGGNTR